MPKPAVVERSHHVRIIVGVPQTIVRGVLEGIDQSLVPSMMDDLLRQFGECITAAPGLSLFGLVAGEFSTLDEIDIDFEVYRRRSHIHSAHQRFVVSINGWAKLRFGNPSRSMDTFVRDVTAAVRSYSVVNSSYPVVPVRPTPSMPDDVATRMKRMRSESLLVVLGWLARKLHDRGKITKALLDRIEYEAEPRIKGRRPNELEW